MLFTFPIITVSTKLGIYSTTFASLFSGLTLNNLKPCNKVLTREGDCTFTILIQPKQVEVNFIVSWGSSLQGVHNIESPKFHGIPSGDQIGGERVMFEMDAPQNGQFILTFLHAGLKRLNWQSG